MKEVTFSSLNIGDVFEFAKRPGHKFELLGKPKQDSNRWYLRVRDVGAVDPVGFTATAYHDNLPQIEETTEVVPQEESTVYSDYEYRVMASEKVGDYLSASVLDGWECVQLVGQGEFKTGVLLVRFEQLR